MRCFLDGLLDSVVVLLPAFRLFASFAIGTDFLVLHHRNN